MRWPAPGLVVLGIVAGILACEGGNGGISLAPVITRISPTPTATVSLVKGLWGPEAVWEVRDGEYSDVRILNKECRVDSISLNPVQHRECILRAMMGTGATSEAMEFFRAYHVFLVHFEELGLVDWGLVAAVWSNMGRPSPVVLNGSPPLRFLAELVPDDWQKEPSYAPVNRLPVWPEYACLVESQNLSIGGQRVIVDYPIREARPPPDLGFVRVAFTFDSGFLHRIDVLPMIWRSPNCPDEAERR